ncbi:MAG: MFS transporter [Halofilum sp. (in: g-proteobacteria)]
MIGLRVFFFFACGFFLSYLYRAVNAVLAPELVGTFELAGSQLGLLTSVYLLAFACSQSVLGLLLDWYGPRRVEATLLLVAATGAVMFALAGAYETLIAGRVLIGIGCSACLMAGLKANAIWFEGRRLPLLNGLFMAAGGIGAVSAGAPVEWALTVTDWRTIFGGLAAVTLTLSLCLFTLVPDRHDAAAEPNARALFGGLARIYASRAFWQVAPATMLSQGSYLATATLWAGPWLSDVSGLDRLAVATHLSVIATGTAVGFLLTGVVTQGLGRFGITPKHVAGSGMAVFIGVQLLIIAWPDGPTMWLWGAYGLFGVSGIITYTTLTQRFGATLSGRANTAAAMATFTCAFVFQAGTGTLLDQFSTGEPGHYTDFGHRLALGTATALQALGLLWYLSFRERSERTAVAKRD